MLEKRKVILTEPGHRYIDEEDRLYTSVTTAIGTFVKKFDARYWSMYKALQRNGYKVKPDIGRWKFITVNGIEISIDSLESGIIPMEVSTSHIKGEWHVITKIACDKGNKVHNQIENGTNAVTDLKQGKKEASALLNFYTLAKQYPEIYSKVKASIDDGYKAYPELIVYLPDPLLAGMIDLPLFKGRRFRIKDWKTNKNELRFDAGYYKKDSSGNVTDVWIDTNETLLWPLTHLAASNGIKYSLQLSLYAYILELWGYELEENGLELCHVRGDFDDNGIFQKSEIKWHQVEYMKEDAKLIVETMKLDKSVIEEKRNQLVF